MQERAGALSERQATAPGADTQAEGWQHQAQVLETPAVETEGVSKSFGDLTVIDSVTLQVRRGELLGLVGPSGCGKTTLVRLMAGLSKPTSGRVWLLGVDPLKRSVAERRRTGYMPQGTFLFPNLSVIRNARFAAGLYGMGWLARRGRIRELLERFELWDARKRRVSETSGGMQRRLALACAVVHSPEVVFVDEPTVGLDPMLRTRIWEYLQGIRDAGTTIVLTTQYVDEAALCDSVAVMANGRVVERGSPDELRRKAIQGDTLEIQGGPFSQSVVDEIGRQGYVLAVDRTVDGVRVRVDEHATATPLLTKVLLERGVTVQAVTPILPSFDEVFAELIGRHGG